MTNKSDSTNLRLITNEMKRFPKLFCNFLSYCYPNIFISSINIFSNTFISIAIILLRVENKSSQILKSLPSTSK